MAALIQVQPLEPLAITPLLGIVAITPPQSTAVLIQLPLKTAQPPLLLLPLVKLILVAANCL